MGGVRVIGSALRNKKVSKSEARNPKQYLMTKIQIRQTKGVPGITIVILFLSLGHLIFEFVSNLEIRISDFAKSRTANHALWA